jgi:hypothetical protein
VIAHRVATESSHRLLALLARCFYVRLMSILTIALSIGLAGSPCFAQAVSKEQMRSLDEQVQEIKSDVLGIAAELNGLEERLLYPSNTHVAVFVSFANGGTTNGETADGETPRLDSARIHIDGELVAHHIYSWKELEALKKGGVQRIYTGNVATGEHRIEVSVAGKAADGGDLAGAGSFSFVKEVEPELVGITLAAGDSGSFDIQLGGW